MKKPIRLSNVRQSCAVWRPSNINARTATERNNQLRVTAVCFGQVNTAVDSAAIIVGDKATIGGQFTTDWRECNVSYVRDPCFVNLSGASPRHAYLGISIKHYPQIESRVCATACRRRSGRRQRRLRFGSDVGTRSAYGAAYDRN